MSIIPLVLASFQASVTQGGAPVAFTAPVDQQRGATAAGVTDFPAGTTYSSTGTRLFSDAVTSRTRWTGVRIVLDGVTLPPGSYHGTVDIDDTLGQPRTARFNVIGHLWAIPTQDSPPLGPFSSSRSWGNRKIEIYLAFGTSPRKMVEVKIFQGVTLQKSNRGDTSVVGEITCIDDSMLSANTALCYSLQPFGGRTRDQVVRDVAVLAGFAADQVIVPVGGAVTKPINLTNASLLPFLSEFLLPENEVAGVDVDGNLRVQRIELKSSPDWVIDGRLGDYDLDQNEERPPSLAPRRYYASASVPLGGGGVDIENDGNDVTALYNPECVKVRPSGQPSYLQSDSSYRTNPTAVQMVVGRTETETTVIAGREVRRVIKTFGMHNPLAKDPNYDTSPPAASFDGAYGDHTFHVYESERLIEIRRETITSEHSGTGALTRRFLEIEEWHARRVAGNFPSRLGPPVSNAAALQLVFSDLTTRTSPQENFHTTKTVERNYGFAGDGTLNTVRETVKGWVAPKGRADIVVSGVVVQVYDFKYAANDWRGSYSESFLTSRETVDTYIAPGGVLTDIRQEVTEYVNPQTGVPADPLSSPPYYFADNSWRLLAAYEYRESMIRTTSFRPHGVGSHEVIVTEFDPVTGTTGGDQVQIVSGPIPGVPTAGSLNTGLVMRPIFGTLTDPALLEFADSKKAFPIAWAETTDEVTRATRRQMQRDSAIMRTVRMAANPLIENGHTVQKIVPKRSTNCLELVVARAFRYDLATGDSSMVLTSEFWVR